MSTTIHSTSNASHIFVADMAAVAARLGGSSHMSRMQTLFVGGCLPFSRCQMAQNPVTYACSRRQLRRIFSS
ncbi:MAG: hypothetical protein JNJ78_22260 [Anaerolineae bacterium]|nr:hypothetical protein [Anaerolineae bacterium]